MIHISYNLAHAASLQIMTVYAKPKHARKIGVAVVFSHIQRHERRRRLHSLGPGDAEGLVRAGRRAGLVYERAELLRCGITGVLQRPDLR